MIPHTITGLKRWSCGTRDLPAASQIKVLHVYDFDNTLFMSPLPNQKLWTLSAMGFLQSQDTFANGGWWHDQHILEATGEGVEKEEPVAWQGWWNEQIASLVKLSMEQNDALTVLLTGRGERNFADIINRMVKSKKLDFDLICLKPQAGPNNQVFASTMKYKQALLSDLVYTYKDADEIRIYEDRPGHTKAFRDFFDDFNKKIPSSYAPTPRKQITAEVIQVADIMTTLDPVIETAEVQRMINSHNAVVLAGSTAHTRSLEIKKTVLFTGYLISPIDTDKLLTLINLPSGMPESGVTFLANNVLISPQPCSAFILNRIGGLGSNQTWQVTGTGVYESKIWAARVSPVPQNSHIHTDGPVPIVVLAHLKNVRPSDAGKIPIWHPVSQEKHYMFQTEVGERVQLGIGRIGVETDEQRGSQYTNKNLKRRYSGLEESQQEHPNFRTQAPSQYQRGRPHDTNENKRPGAGGNHGNMYKGGAQNRGRVGGGPGNGGGSQHRHPPHASGRGGGRVGGGGNRGGGAGNKGRGRGGYKSLDDVGGGRYGGGGGQGGGAGSQNQHQQPNYDDFLPPHGGDAYSMAFPALGPGGGGGRDHSGSGMNQDETYPPWGK